MTTMISADSLHRLVKQAIDSGAAASIAEQASATDAVAPPLVPAPLVGTPPAG